MKNSPKENAQILNLHAPAVRLAGTRRHKADQLMDMFDDAETRIKRENDYRGDREAFRIKG